MDDTIKERVCKLAVYLIETGLTVRAAAKYFGIRTCPNGFPILTRAFTSKCGRYWTRTRPSGTSAAVWLPGKNTAPKRNKSETMPGCGRASFIGHRHLEQAFP